MADVFLSYKSEDRRRLEPLVAALERDGVSVWWDARIGAGEAWREEIQSRLDAARCVIVAWSRRSTGPEGRFVRDEATRAQRRGVYLPIRLDEAEPPLGFGEVQALSLADWRGAREHAGYQALLAAVRALTDAPASAAAAPSRRPARRGVLLAAGAPGAVALGGERRRSGGLRAREGPPGSARIAVLPFANLSGDPGQAYFSDGVTEELRTVLSRLPGVEVIGAVSSQAVRELTPVQVAARLGAAQVLMGSVRRSPSLIRVAAQLVEGRSGVQRWSDTYDRTPGDALALESGIAESVAEALRLRLDPTAARALAVGGTRDVNAHDLYLRAKALWRSSDDVDDARTVLTIIKAALALDPRYGDALVLQANVTTYLGELFVATAREQQAGMAEGEAIARRAILAAPGLASAYVSLGSALEGQLKFRAALAAYTKGLSLASAPSSRVAMFLALMGRTSEAIGMAKAASVLDPLNAAARNLHAYVLFIARRFRDSIDIAEPSLSIAPKMFYTHWYIGASKLVLGDPEGALAAIKAMPPDNVNRLVVEAVAAHKLGHAVDPVLAHLKAAGGDGANYQYAAVYAQIGQNEPAIAALQEALRKRDPGLSSLRSDIFMDPLRKDPRFQTLLASLDFP